MQVIGSYSRCREFYYFGVGLWFFPFRSFPRQGFEMYIDMPVPLPKAFHVPRSCLSSGRLTTSYLDSSCCFHTSARSFVSSLLAIIPSSIMSAYAKSPWFPNSSSDLPFQLPVFWDLLTYPGSQPFSRPPPCSFSKHSRSLPHIQLDCTCSSLCLQCHFFFSPSGILRVQH